MLHKKKKKKKSKEEYHSMCGCYKSLKKVKEKHSVWTS